VEEAVKEYAGGRRTLRWDPVAERNGGLDVMLLCNESGVGRRDGGKKAVHFGDKWGEWRSSWGKGDRSERVMVNCGQGRNGKHGGGIGLRGVMLEWTHPIGERKGGRFD